MNVLESIKKFLDENRVEYKCWTHAPVHTSEEAAKIRGTPIESGAKALVLRSEGKFLMVVIAGDKKMDLKKVKQAINSRRLSLATPEEVLQATHCVIGSIPPFGNLFNIPVYLDKSLLRSPIINFNAGRHDTSIAMPVNDYKKTVKPVIVDVAQESA
jgi:Ala-tRNA(Pro) deacylase